MLHNTCPLIRGRTLLLELADGGIKTLPLAHDAPRLIQLGLFGHGVVAKVNGLGLAL